MPTAGNWGRFIFTNVAFAAMIALIIYSSSVADIKENWSEYRCNPLYMPLSDNMEQDFQYCIQNTQMNYMGYILQPLTFLTSSLTQNAGAFTEDINNIRGMFDKVRTFLSTAVQSIFGVFLNLVIEFQRITISIKDLMGKTIGILVTVLYMMDGSVKTMQATNNGPPGQMLRSLGKCFHPSTAIMVARQSGATLVPISEVREGDTLWRNGEKVLSVLDFPNWEDEAGYEALYQLRGMGEGGADIYLTGSHHIICPIRGCAVAVKDWPAAIAQEDTKASRLICLVTDAGTIGIGHHVTFCDYTV